MVFSTYGRDLNGLVKVISVSTSFSADEMSKEEMNCELMSPRICVFEPLFGPLITSGAMPFLPVE